MIESITARRENDAILVICQDNSKKVLEILGVNSAAENLLNYTEHELLYKPLISILNYNVVNDIINYVDYLDNGTDLFDVLNKVRNFAFVDRNMVVKPVKIKIFRTSGIVENKIHYELLARDVSLSHKLQIFRNELLGTDIRYTFNDDLGILDEISMGLELNIIVNFVNSNSINATVAVISLDEISNITKVNDSMKTIVYCLYKNLRSEDVIGYIGNNKIAIVLMNCDLNDVRNVIFRMHSLINSLLKDANLPTISIGYHPITNQDTSISLLNKIDVALMKIQSQGGNQITLGENIDSDIGDFTKK